MADLKSLTVNGIDVEAKLNELNSNIDNIVTKGVTDIYTRSKYKASVSSFTVQTRYSSWENSSTNRQSFLIWGCCNSAPILTIAIVSNAGSFTFLNMNSSNPITGTKGSNGQVTFSVTNSTFYDYITVMSAYSFEFV